MSNEFDIQIFQDLPLYVQKDILSTVKVIYSGDFKETFEIFMKTIREFEDFCDEIIDVSRVLNDYMSKDPVKS
ncbi:MAG: hypothetical protein J5U19_12955 [Candidatus Methanoperedens sp.]|nr:hypothetical protein [Candidatus Methanoperedens sp.]